MNRKRRPIRRKVQQLVLAISILATEAVGVVALASMLYLRRQSRKALTAQVSQHLLTAVKDKAALIDSEFGKFAAYTSLFAERIHGRYVRGAGVARAGAQQPPAADASLPPPTADRGADSKTAAVAPPSSLSSAAATSARSFAAPANADTMPPSATTALASAPAAAITLSPSSSLTSAGVALPSTNSAPVAPSHTVTASTLLSSASSSSTASVSFPPAASASALPPPAEGGFASRRILAHEGVSLADVGGELRLLESLAPLFTSVMEANGGVVTSVYAATASGVCVTYDKNPPPADEGGVIYYDFLSKDWFTRGLTESAVFFTGVYRDGFERGLTVTCASPFYDGAGKVRGVVAMDMFVADLYTSVVALDFDRALQPFLIDAQGCLVAVDGLAEPLSSAYDLDVVSARTLLAQSEGMVRSSSGARYAFAAVPTIGWKFCAYIPERLLVQSVRAINKSIVATIGVFVLLLSLILALVLLAARRFSEQLTRPLIQLRRDVKKISGGNFKHQAHVYENDEIGDLATGFNQMAVSLKRYVEYVAAMTAENERIHAELDVATKIQADMLPSRFPAFPDRAEFDIYASMTTAKEVGGDFYDFFFTDGDHLAVVMGDVSGKGVPAALFMVNAKTLLKNRALLGGTPSQIVTQVNNQLCELNDGAMFVTVWFGILELSTGLFTATNAGHECPALRRAGGRYALVQNEHCPPLGAEPDLLFDEVTVPFSAGDSLFLYTDGAAEAKNSAGEEFGTARLLAALNAAGAGAAAKAGAVLSGANAAAEADTVLSGAGAAAQADIVLSGAGAVAQAGAVPSGANVAAKADIVPTGAGAVAKADAVPSGAGVAANANITPQEQLRAVAKAIDGFAGKAPQYDDITLLALTYFGAVEYKLDFSI